MTRTYSLLLFLLVIFCGHLSAETYEVSLDQAEIRLSTKGRKVGSLLKGTRVEAIGRKGNWLKFRFEGWIYLPSLKLVPESAKKGVGGYITVTPDQVSSNPERYKGKKIKIVGIKFYGYRPGVADNLKVSLGTDGIGYLPVSDRGKLEGLKLYQKINVKGEVLDIIGSLYFIRIDEIET